MKTHIESTHQNRLTGGIELALAAFALLLTAAAPALAGHGNVGNPQIAPPQSHFRGQSYGEWAAAYFQWVYSLPVTAHPLFDTADCSAGQTGNVWFIDGTHGQPFPPAGRDCTIQAGTAIFLALAATFQDNEACNGNVIQRTSFTESELRAMAYTNFNNFLGHRGIVIDGVTVLGLPDCDPSDPSTCQTPYRVQSPVFDYTVPAFDNILIGDDGPCYDNPTGNGEPYTARGVVADGVFVMIKPLPVGEHIFQFGPLPALSRLYRITVE